MHSYSLHRQRDALECKHAHVIRCDGCMQPVLASPDADAVGDGLAVLQHHLRLAHLLHHALRRTPKRSICCSVLFHQHPLPLENQLCPFGHLRAQQTHCQPLGTTFPPTDCG